MVEAKRLDTERVRSRPRPLHHDDGGDGHDHGDGDGDGQDDLDDKIMTHSWRHRGSWQWIQTSGGETVSCAKEI